MIATDLEPLLGISPLRVRSSNPSSRTFIEFCRQNPELRVEQDAEGILEIMAPTFSETGIYSGRLFRQLDEHCERTGSGYAFDSSAGFALPDGAKRSPDASWIPSDKWESLSNDEQQSFAQICPDFVIELMSKSDSLSQAQAKMAEYLRNGSRMGFLIDRKTRTVFVYRPNEEAEELVNPTEVSAEPVIPGFALQMARLF